VERTGQRETSRGISKMLESAVRKSPGWKEDGGNRGVSSFVGERCARGANHSRYADLEEPLLADLLNDSLTHRLMVSDGVKEKHLLLVIVEAQARLNGA